MGVARNAERPPESIPADRMATNDGEEGSVLKFMDKVFLMVTKP